MTIDISQFLQTFYEESSDGLEVMESNLLKLDAGAADLEVVNTIFRAAHSIKGGSATFGLTGVTSLTHLLETYLDEMRDGRRQASQEGVSLLLDCVDCLRDMLSRLQRGESKEPEQVSALKNRLSNMIGIQSAGLAPPQTSGSVQAHESNAKGWRISFRPHSHLFHTGNDPVRILRELADLGELTVNTDTGSLPVFESLSPEECYLSWSMSLIGDVEQSAVEEAFAWVADDCELEIEELNAMSDEDAMDQSLSGRVKDTVPGEGNITQERRRGERRAAGVNMDSSSIRVSIDKIDAVINLVGELVITQSMLSTMGDNLDIEHLHSLQEGLEQLGRNTRELQENVMRMRMLPISFLFNRFPRMVRDVSAELGKRVVLDLVGEGTELDKTVMEKIGDPLVHLVRNALDHGIESPEMRQAAGKNAAGMLRLDAFHKGGNIVIKVTDDGAGLDRERILAKAKEKHIVQEGQILEDSDVLELIFHPGLSTADSVSDLSGRGVGMDVVRRNIKELGGSVEIESSAGSGTTFTIRLPLTLSIVDGQLVQVGESTYVIPLVSIIESIQVHSDCVNAIAGKSEVYKLRSEYIPIVRLCELFGGESGNKGLDGALMVVVEGDGRKAGLIVDDLLGQQQVVVKSLETNFRRVDGISGATILGDGTVALIADAAGMIHRLKYAGQLHINSRTESNVNITAVA